VGDRIDTFAPGHLVLVGPNLPHDWISDVPSGQKLEGRDVVVQFREEWLRQCQEVLPELDALDDLLADSARGLEFRGATAREAAGHMERVGTSEGAARIEHLFGLLNVPATGPEHERRPLPREWFMPQGDQRVVEVMDIALKYILENIAGDLRMRVLAERVGMSESGFSKYFLKASNMTFTEMVRGLRLSQACRMLARDEDTIASISQQVGYSNLSNFNRQFMREYGMTPSAFRRRERNTPVTAASGG
jgi:AraC-like DNA-binding protein